MVKYGSSQIQDMAVIFKLNLNYMKKNKTMKKNTKHKLKIDTSSFGNHQMTSLLCILIILTITLNNRNNRKLKKRLIRAP